MTTTTAAERNELATEIAGAMDHNGMLSAAAAARIAGPTRPQLHSQMDCAGLARALGCLDEFRAACERAASGEDYEEEQDDEQDAPRNPMQATSLDDLLSRVQALPTDDDRDLTRLPTFGGEEPDSTHGVFSWDAGRLLVQDRTGWRIVARSERQ